MDFRKRKNNHHCVYLFASISAKFFIRRSDIIIYIFFTPNDVVIS